MVTRMDWKAVGLRIRGAREAQQIPSHADLARRLSARLGKKIARQSVQQWEAGKHPPEWDTIEALSAELRVGEEELLFDRRRDAQIAKDKRYLAHVSEAEADLLTAYRSADPGGQASIVATAKELAKLHAAPIATLHPLRRKDDLKRGRGS